MNAKRVFCRVKFNQETGASGGFTYQQSGGASQQAAQAAAQQGKK